jgi:hypothetical protein
MATQTLLTTQVEQLHLHSSAPGPPAQKLQLNMSNYPKLDKNQAGHVRHFHNLSSQLDGEWHHMGIQEPGQEFLDALRYQLATMAYATGATHYYHLPLLRAVFKPLIRKLIYKMLRREVWGYWFNTSLSGSRVDPSLKELRKPWADPVIKVSVSAVEVCPLLISIGKYHVFGPSLVNDLPLCDAI